MKNLLLFLLMAFAGIFPGEERARGTGAVSVFNPYAGDALSAGMAGKTAEGLGALGKAGWRWIVGSSPQTYQMTLQTTGSMAGQYLMESVEQTATKVPFVQMAGQAGVRGGKVLLEAPKVMHKHHIFPQEFRRYFTNQGIAILKAFRNAEAQ
ncbi:MAG: hypothetical protein R3C61_16645 [Bacteroidia bacterium]